MEAQTKKDNPKSSRLRSLGDSLSGGRWITQNLNFFLFLSAMAVLYIANGHMADKAIRNINKTQQEIKDLQYEYKTVKSEVMYKSEEAQVEKAAEPLGLKITKDVPQRLQVEK
ncbi:FtsL-like putative cell division protein [Parasediminibacterium sp. JCM 36343]|uniref:FtsL-like putative cell division protein n=1 Tax=Parasediminibacterium sp. JCM 36343 TaxID=3374279 RepID=UPI00397E8833